MLPADFKPIQPLPKPKSYCCQMLWSSDGVEYDFDKWWIDSFRHEEIFFCPFCGKKLEKLGP